VSAEAWSDDDLTADDRRMYRHPCRCSHCWPGLPALSVTPAPRPVPDRTAEIDAVVTEAITGAARIEAWLIRAGLWAVAILLPLAIVLGLIHALGTVIGLIIPASIAGLAGFIYLDQRRN